MTRSILILLLIVTHLLAARSFWERLRAQRLPRTVDFACLSIMLYYDLDLALEALGVPYHNAYFNSLFEAEDSRFLHGMLLLSLAPWLLLVGAWINQPEGRNQPQEPTSSRSGNSAISEKGRAAEGQGHTSQNSQQDNQDEGLASIASSKQSTFYVLITLVTLVVTFYGVRQLLGGEALWQIRARMGSALGPLIIILYLPLYFLAFYVRQKQSRTRGGLMFSLFLTFAAVAAAAGIGERTNILLPFLILALFRFKPTLPRLALTAAVLVVCAASLLTFVKWQYADRDANLAELVQETIAADLARAGVLESALEVSGPVGSHIMPYPMTGYVYSALFFVPRSIAPFKGTSTAKYLTGHLAGSDPDETFWEFGVGAIEELTLNVGWLLALPGLLLYGMALGWINTLSQRMPSLVVPSRLAAVWLCGYNLPSLLLLFGAMSLVGVALHRLFSQEQHNAALLRPATGLALPGGISRL